MLLGILTVIHVCLAALNKFRSGCLFLLVRSCTKPELNPSSPLTCSVNSHGETIIEFGQQDSCSFGHEGQRGNLFYPPMAAESSPQLGWAYWDTFHHLTASRAAMHAENQSPHPQRSLITSLVCDCFEKRFWSNSSWQSPLDNVSCVEKFPSSAVSVLSYINVD